MCDNTSIFNNKKNNNEIIIIYYLINYDKKSNDIIKYLIYSNM